MVKKLFALASVTALTGLMVSVAAAGCSSTTTETDPGTDAATSPDTGKVKTDGGTNTGDDEEAPADTTCKGLTEVDATQLPWKAPYKELGACTSAELDKLVAYVEANDTAKYADWKKQITNTACNGCMFGKEADTAWRPLLENTAGELVGLNVGGCIAIASGNEKCGQAYQNWFDCGFEACADCAADDSAGFSKCRTAANSAKGGCKKALDNVVTVCGAAIDTAEPACDGKKYVFEGPIKAQCIGLTDGGDQ